MKLVIVSLLAILTATHVNAECGKCGKTSGVKCLSASTFAFCDAADGDEPHSCPKNTFCSDTIDICTEERKVVDCAPTCQKCRHDGRFACTGRTTYSLCFGKSTPSLVHGECPHHQVCSTKATGTHFCIFENEALKADCENDDWTNQLSEAPIKVGHHPNIEPPKISIAGPIPEPVLQPEFNDKGNIIKDKRHVKQ